MDVEPSGDNELSLELDFDGFGDEDGLAGFLNKIMGMVGKLAGGVSNWATGMMREKMPVSVSYQVKVPGNCNLEVRGVTGDLLVTGVEGGIEAKLVTGNISLVDIGGELDCSVVAGQIEIEGAGGFIETSVITGVVTISVARDREFNGIDCTVISGDVLVRLPEGTALDFDLRAINGNITHDTDLIRGKMVHGTRHKGSVAGGGPKLEIKAINGSIRVERTVR